MVGRCPLHPLHWVHFPLLHQLLWPGCSASMFAPCSFTGPSNDGSSSTTTTWFSTGVIMSSGISLCVCVGARHFDGAPHRPELPLAQGLREPNCVWSAGSSRSFVLRRSLANSRAKDLFRYFHGPIRSQRRENGRMERPQPKKQPSLPPTWAACPERAQVTPNRGQTGDLYCH